MQKTPYPFPRINRAFVPSQRPGHMRCQRKLANAAPGPGAFRGVHPHEPPPASGV
jgi:hypothetical protein